MAAWLGKRRVEFEVCDSTNDEAAKLAAEGAEHGTLVIARAQRRGRGRQGRAWYSPPGENLYMSFLLRPALEPSRVSAITLAVGVAVAETVNSLRSAAATDIDIEASSTASGTAMTHPVVEASLKWPNDVLLGGRKLAGILTEMSTRAHGIEHVIVGIGLNIGSRAFPAELADRATSLALCGVVTEPGTLIAALIEGLETWLERFFAGGVAAIADRWLALAGLQRRREDSRPEVGLPVTAPRVRVDVSGRPIEGAIRGLDENGFLVVEDDSGRVHRVIAGDVEPISTQLRDNE